MIDDATLLHRYAANRSQDAFAELVRRHLPLVYSAAIRRLEGDTHRAADVTQAVFARVARDADQLARHAALTGWLYTATRNAAIDIVRSEQRRRIREQEAHIMQEISAPAETPIDWAKLHPVLDDVMDELEDDDREAVLLRYFQNRPFAEIARVIGLSEDAARKRVDRAVERLRSLLRQHGITSTSAALATVLANETALAAPATLANTIVGAAVANSVAGGTAILTSAAKLWIGIAAAAAIGGAAGVVSQQRTIAELRENETHVRQQMAKLSIENAISVKAQASTERELDALRTELAAAQSAVSGVRRTTASNQPNNSSASAAPSSGNTAQPKDRWHGRFEGFVRQRGLTPDQADRFYEILGQWDDTSRDFQASVRAQGLMATPATQKLRDQLQQQLEVEPLIALLGRDGERAYFEFEGNVFYQAMVDPVAQRLANANLPLTDDEKSQLVALVKSNVHSIKRDPTSMSSEAVVDWTPVVASAGNFLKPSQVDQLKAYASRQHEGVR